LLISILQPWHFVRFSGIFVTEIVTEIICITEIEYKLNLIAYNRIVTKIIIRKQIFHIRLKRKERYFENWN